MSEWVGPSAEVFSAIGTVGAFVVTLYLLRQEMAREEQRREEERRSQAVRVSAWIEAVRNSHGTRELQFFVHNASDMPIYEVALTRPSDGGEDEELQFIGLVPPGQTIQRPAPIEWLSEYDSPEPTPVEFTDSSGATWVRGDTGQVARV